MDYVWLTVGLIVLSFGAEFLVRGASALALAARISRLIIGLTIVAFGTSAPELVVSLQAGLGGQSAIALGNVVGSNILNVLFILGLSAAIVPLTVNQQLIRFDVPLLVVVSAAVFAMCLDGEISRLDGGLLVTGMIAYLVWMIRQSRRDASLQRELASAEFDDIEQELHLKENSGSPGWGILLWQGMLVVVGLAMLTLGSRFFCDAAVNIARTLGVSELVIGVTIVAAGTSLPEVATSLMAAIRGERDIAVGNVIGSNLFNLMCVLGVTGILTGIRVPAEALQFDLPVMTAVAIACLPIFFTGHQIARWEGFLFFFYYLVYTGYLVLQAMGSSHLPAMTATMLWLVIPLTVLTLAIGVVRMFCRGPTTDVA